MIQEGWLVGGQHGRGRPYSIDLRERVVALVLEDGQSRNKAASHFAVAVSTVVSWVKRYQETGTVEPGRMGGHKPKAIRGEHEAFLAQRVREGAFTLRGLVRELADRGLKVDYRSVWNFVHAEKLSFKNVWPAPFARGFFEIACNQSASTYPVSEASSGQDGDTRAPGLIKLSASSAVF